MDSRSNSYYKILTGFMLLLVLTLPGCGQKGDLYIPDELVTMAKPQIYIT